MTFAQGLPFLIAPLALWCGACHPRHLNETAGVKEFEPAPFVNGQATRLELPRALGIPYVVQRFRVADEESSEENLSRTPWFYRIRFPELTADQFEKLKQSYTGHLPLEARSRVRFPAGAAKMTDVGLEDLLFPLLQAVNEKRFIPEKNAAMTRDFGFGNFTNCWGTAYEILRHMKDPSKAMRVFWVTSPTIVRVLTSSKFADLVYQGPIEENESATARQERNSKLRTGDLLLVQATDAMDQPQWVSRDGETWLDNSTVKHAAIFIDDDLFFEKIHAGRQESYRFTTWSQIQKKYGPSLGYFMRFGEGKSPLPPPEVAFDGGTFRDALPTEDKAKYTASCFRETSVDCKDSYTPIGYFNLLLDETSGRTSLAKEAFQAGQGWNFTMESLKLRLDP